MTGFWTKGWNKEGQRILCFQRELGSTWAWISPLAKGSEGRWKLVMAPGGLLSELHDLPKVPRDVPVELVEWVIGNEPAP